MKQMSSSPVEPADLIDLKLLPAWVKEPAEPRSYEHYRGEEGERPRDGRRPPRDKRGRNVKRAAFDAQRPLKARKADAREPKKVGRDSERVRERGRSPRRSRSKAEARGGRPRMDQGEDRRYPVARMPLEITTRFLPYSRIFGNV